MDHGQWNEQQAKLEHEFKKDSHRWKLEWFAAILIVIAVIACIVALIVSKGSSSWAQSLLCTIVGAALGFVLKSSSNKRHNGS